MKSTAGKVIAWFARHVSKTEKPPMLRCPDAAERVFRTRAWPRRRSMTSRSAAGDARRHLLAFQGQGRTGARHVRTRRYRWKAVFNDCGRWRRSAGLNPATDRACADAGGAVTAAADGVRHPVPQVREDGRNGADVRARTTKPQRMPQQKLRLFRQAVRRLGQLPADTDTAMAMQALHFHGRTDARMAARPGAYDLAAHAEHWLTRCSPACALRRHVASCVAAGDRLALPGNAPTRGRRKIAA